MRCTTSPRASFFGEILRESWLHTDLWLKTNFSLKRIGTFMTSDCSHMSKASKTREECSREKWQAVTTMKRGSASDNLPEAKKLKDDKVPNFEELRPIQEEILQLDEECAKEQMKVQQRFAAKLRPLYGERQKLLKKIPNFWGSIIQDIIPLEQNMTLCQSDKEILNHLEEVDVEDSLDERGSYRITFKFNPGGISKYFSPATLVKTVTFSEDLPGEAKAESTTIIWTGGKNLVKEVEEKRKATEDDPEGIEEYSFLEWFTNFENFDFPPIGETLRREVWPNPLVHLLGDSSDEEEDDES